MVAATFDLATTTTRETEHAAAPCPRPAHAQHDNWVRDRLVLDNMALVHRMASRLKRRVPSTVEFDDLTQAGLVGLLEAARRYLPNTSTPFAVYASPRVHGAMVDVVRKLAPAPRTLPGRMREIDAARRRIENATGQHAPAAAIARELGLSDAVYHRTLLERKTARSLSVDGALVDDDLLAGESAGRIDADPQAEIEVEQARLALNQALSKLPDHERVVLELHYGSGWKLSQIGQLLRVTESRVSQLHRQALTNARRRLLRQTSSVTVPGNAFIPEAA